MEDDIRRKLDYVYFIHKAGGTDAQRTEAVADVFDEILLALPRWTTQDILIDAFAMACSRHQDLQAKGE